MQITFHFTRWSGRFSKIIAGWTGERFSHVHIELEGYGHFELAAGHPGRWYPGFPPGEGLLDHASCTFNLDAVTFSNVATFISGQGGKGYDWLGIARMALNFRTYTKRPSRWFCSALAATLIKEYIRYIDLPEKAPALTPTELYEALRAEGWRLPY